MKYGLLLVLVALLFAAWLNLDNRKTAAAANIEISPSKITSSSHVKTAIFAAGCFWGVQERFDRIPGVISTEAGYTGGTLSSPTYEDVCSHQTGHAEAVQVTFDSSKVSFAELLDTFWSIHDPTTVDRQGPDIGNNYRSAIFCVDAEQEKSPRPPWPKSQPKASSAARSSPRSSPSRSSTRPRTITSTTSKPMGGLATTVLRSCIPSWLPKRKRNVKPPPPRSRSVELSGPFRRKTN